VMISPTFQKPPIHSSSIAVVLGYQDLHFKAYPDLHL
jgi:hypothetical protein